MKGSISSCVKASHSVSLSLIPASVEVEVTQIFVDGDEREIILSSSHFPGQGRRCNVFSLRYSFISKNLRHFPVERAQRVNLVARPLIGK